MNPLTDPHRPYTQTLMEEDRTEEVARAEWMRTPEYREAMRQDELRKAEQMRRVNEIRHKAQQEAEAEAIAARRR
jgi:hypothetical protein